MRQGSVRGCFQIERCPRLPNSLTSTLAALRIFYAALIASEDVRVLNGFRSERKLKHEIA
jgi:hypothetical protein